MTTSTPPDERPWLPRSPARPGGEGSDTGETDAALRRVRTLAHWLDARFTVPGTPVRFGLDTLVGLLPVVGDTATLLVGLYPVAEAARLGLRKRVLAKMAANLGVDWVVGLVPGVDLVLDTWFKAHLRNAKLLEAELRAGRVPAAGQADRFPGTNEKGATP